MRSVKNLEQRGPVGRWLFLARKQAGVKNVPDAVALVEERTGVRIIESTYTQYEGGRELKKAEHRAALEQVWGPQPTESAQESAPQSSSELGALVAHLKEQDRRIDQLLALVERLTATPLAPASQGQYVLDLSQVPEATRAEVQRNVRMMVEQASRDDASTRSPRQ